MEPRAAAAAGSCWLKALLLRLSRALVERLVPGRWLQLILLGWAQLTGRLPAVPEDEAPDKELLQAATRPFLLVSTERLSLWEADLLDGHINNMVSYVLGPGAGRAQCLSWVSQGYSLCALQEALCKIAPEERALFKGNNLDQGDTTSRERLAEIQHIRMKRLEFLQQRREDHDHGYCSLEEGHTMKALLQTCDQGRGTPVPPDQPSHVYSISCQTCEEDSDIEDDLPVSSRPVCSNKLIDYILGATSSDEEDDACSHSEEDWGEGEEDDDGFNSEGTLSDCDNRNQEYDRLYLWNPFYTVEPYAAVQIDACRENACVLEEDVSVKSELEDAWCESLQGSQCSSSEEEDDDSEESADEAENLKLWNSFSNCDDPYNPLNFKATFQTAVRKHPESYSLDEQAGLGLANSQCCLLSYRVQPLESHRGGILNTDQHEGPSQEASIYAKRKKVTFLDEITEYYVSSEEDRKGCWEEFARDRCRFQKRIQETEEAIGYCLSSDHRQKIQDQWQKCCS